MRLKGKVAIVTGASQGIGQVIAQVMAREGARIVLAARSESNLEETAKLIADEGGISHMIPTDITDEASVEKLIKETISHFGGVDILINNSGVAGPMKAVEDISVKEWEECFEVNVTGMFLCCKHAIPVMKEKRSGRIVNISSMTGKRPLVHRSPYAASKMAVIGLTRTLAFEVGEFGVTVNTVCPGATEGERIRRVIANESKALGISLEQAESNFTGALNTLVLPEDTANMCVFLCSEEGRHMTGQDINVTAGLCWY
ncbi:MAG: SDR family oxidoreductase [Nitrospinaceae bacterium]|nr:SDR family oxidoreductase [Nitrospinaceae bacterium]